MHRRPPRPITPAYLERVVAHYLQRYFTTRAHLRRLLMQRVRRSAEYHGSDVDERSDIYSLGVIFHEMLTGRKPYRADTAMGIIYLHANAPIPLLPTRFAKYQALLNMILAKSPDDRLQSAAEIDEWL